MLVASLFLSSNIFVIKSRELCYRTLNMEKSCNLVPASLWLECFVLGVFLMEILIHPIFFLVKVLWFVFLIFDILLIIVLALLVTSDSSVVLHSKCLLFNWNAYLTIAGCLQKSIIRFTFRWQSHRRGHHLLNQKRKVHC
jgi:hypothetical protein